MHTHDRRPSTRRLTLTTLAAGLSLVATQLLFVPSGSGSPGPTSTGIEVTAPSNAATNTEMSGDAVSCAAPGSCYQVGSFADGSGNQWPALGVIADGNAEQYFSMQGELPSNKLATPSDDVLDGISCPNVGQCQVIGSYQKTGGGSAPYTFEWDALGDYAIPPSSIKQLTLPANATSPGSANTDGISCTTFGNCVAVGSYDQNGVGTVPLVLTETNGIWATGFTPGSEPSGFTGGSFYGVSCATTSNCVAVGTEYVSGVSVAVYFQETAGIWQSSPTLIALPNDKNSLNAFAQLNAVSCTAAGTCESVGSYYNATNNTVPLTVQRISGTWQIAGTVTLPGDAISPHNGVLTGVSCITTDGLCEAVGWYAIPSAGYNSMTVLSRGGTWRGAQTVPAPAALGATVPDAALWGVTCVQSGACVSSGQFIDFAGNQQAMWAPVNTPPSPVTSISVTQTSLSAATVAWVPSVITGAGTDHYEVYESTDGGLNYLDLGSAGTATSSHVTGLVAGHVYHFKVIATDVALVGSGPTYVTYTQAAPPSVPRAPHATPQHLAATLSWTPPASTGFAPILSYRVTVTWAGGSVVRTVTTTHVVVTGLSHAKTYGFSVKATNRAGSSASSSVVHFVPAP